MDGLADLFKHFTANRLLSAALLIASTILIFGPHYTLLIPAIPSGWQPIGVGTMIITAVQCIWWTASGISACLPRLFAVVVKRLFPLTPRKLDENELKLMSICAAHCALESIELDWLAELYQKNFASKLAFVQAAHSLENRRLLGPVRFGYLGFTDEGRAFAVKYSSELPGTTKID